MRVYGGGLERVGVRERVIEGVGWWGLGGG